MRVRALIPALTVACLCLLGCERVATDTQGPDRPSFITYGTLDGNAHPAVVLVVMDVAGQPAFRIAGVTSFGLNGNCAGTGGVFRLDRQNVLDFVTHYLE